jgi:hypothetical protein
LMVAWIRVTAVWAKTRPLREEPAAKATLVFTRKIPSRCEVASAATNPATCQKMLEFKAPPLRRTRTPLPASRLPVILKMKTSDADPLMVMSLVKKTSLPHSCTPAVKVSLVLKVGFVPVSPRKPPMR